MHGSRGVLMLVAALAACGGDDGASPADAPPTSSDGPDTPADAPSGRVQVTVTRSYEGEGTIPVAGADVYFQHPDGRVAAAVEADAMGQASAIVEVGGYVTLDDNGRLYTITDVQPGDELGIDTRFLLGGGLTVTLQYALHEGATTYRVHTPCGVTELSGDGEDTIVLELCEPTLDLVVVAANAAGAALASVRRDDIAPANGATLDLTVETYVAATSSTWTFSNVPDLVADIRVEGMYRLESSWRSVVVATSPAPELEGTATTGAVAVPALANVHLTTIAALETNASARHYVMTWGPATPTTDVDVGAALLPDITGPTTFDLATRTFTWPTTASGATPDVAHASLELLRGSTRWSWMVAAPYAGGTLKLPALPPAIAAYEPRMGELRSQRIATAKLPGGYATVKRNLRFGAAPDTRSAPTVVPPLALASESGQAAFTLAQ